ncbi:hypothetical protein BGD62_002295 [Salmonella enterica]|nr:hypothetical protein [Salmonella enterica]
MTTITREQVQKIIDAADEVITALAGTNDDVHLDNSTKMTQLYDDLNDHYAPPEVVRELARIALASLDAEQVGEVSEKRHGLVMDGTVDLGGKSTYRIIKGEKAMKRLPLGTKFYIVPPVPVDNEFIPKNLDRALGVVGVALPESKEEFNFQTERWIQRLIDRVIRYADEFKEQPMPVVSFYRDGIEAAASWVDKQRQAFDNEHGRYDSDTGAFEFGNDAQRDYSDTLAELADGIRGLHPNAGDNSPVTPDGYALVPVEPTDEMIAAAMNCEDVLFNSDESFCVQFGNIYEAMLAAAPQK